MITGVLDPISSYKHSVIDLHNCDDFSMRLIILRRIVRRRIVRPLGQRPNQSWLHLRQPWIYQAQRIEHLMSASDQRNRGHLTTRSDRSTNHHRPQKTIITQMISLLISLQNRTSKIQEKRIHRIHKWLYSIRSRSSIEWMFNSRQKKDFKFYFL